MPRYEVRLGRTSSIYERAYVTVEADDEYHAKALAIELGQVDDEVDWTLRDHDLHYMNEVDAEGCEEVKDDQV